MDDALVHKKNRLNILLSEKNFNIKFFGKNCQNVRSSICVSNLSSFCWPKNMGFISVKRPPSPPLKSLRSKISFILINTLADQF